MADRQWIIFTCPHDGSIVVSKLEGHMALGVAECPDMRTAEAVREAMGERDKLPRFQDILPGWDIPEWAAKARVQGNLYVPAETKPKPIPGHRWVPVRGYLKLEKATQQPADRLPSGSSPHSRCGRCGGSFPSCHTSGRCEGASGRRDGAMGGICVGRHAEGMA